MLQNLLSAAVVSGTLRVKTKLRLACIDLYTDTCVFERVRQSECALSRHLSIATNVLFFLKKTLCCQGPP